MKIESILSVSMTDMGYDVTVKTENGVTAIAHTDEQWVVQSVSRVEKIDEQFNITEYSVIPQPVREMIATVKTDDSILESLLMNGEWHNV